ncbi:MAG TPA: hypothetical protein VF541_16925 [Longimicrobium sp.]|jgi:hypothetical protein
MRIARRYLRACGAAALLGCTHAQDGRATLRPVCAPTDAFAVMLEVPATSQEYPRFRLRMDRPLAEVAGRQVVVRDPDQPSDTYADWCDGNQCRVVRAATPTIATFGEMRRDSSVTVRVRTAGPDGKPFAWDGVARWHGERLVCG